MDIVIIKNEVVKAVAHSDTVVEIRTTANILCPCVFGLVLATDLAHQSLKVRVLYYLRCSIRAQLMLLPSAEKPFAIRAAKYTQPLLSNS